MEAKTINEIVEWYKINVNHPINDDLLIYMVKSDMIKAVKPSLYNLEDVNRFLLEYYNNQLKIDENGKYIMKPNRIDNVRNFILKDETNLSSDTPRKYKLTTLNGNKLKLIKLS